jgi:hypothetical protein
MRAALVFALPLIALGAPAAAAPERTIPDIPPELTSPETAQKLGKMAGVLSKALLDLEVGEIAAAAEGREASPAEKRRTVRDLAAKGDPDLERDIERQVAAAGPMISRSMKAMSAALPALIRAMEGVADEMERATANLPQPGYPRR